MLWRALIGSARVNFKLTGPIPGAKGPIMGPRGGPLDSKVRKTTSFFWEGPTQPEGPSMANLTPVTRALAARLSV